MSGENVSISHHYQHISFEQKSGAQSVLLPLSGIVVVNVVRLKFNFLR